MSATSEPEESNPNLSKDEDIQGELHALQRTYDEFLDSSRMLETELEKELSETGKFFLNKIRRKMNHTIRFNLTLLFRLY